LETLADENQERVELYNISADRFESKDFTKNPTKTKELRHIDDWQGH
jgi:hypothetical protein